MQKNKLLLAALLAVGVSLLGCSAEDTETGSDTDTTSTGGRQNQTRPVVVISTPTTADSYTAPQSTVALAGTASATGGNIVEVVWSSSRGSGGKASGTVSWTASGVGLEPGTNVITVTARDSTGSTGSSSLIITYNTASNPAATYYLSPDGNDASDGRSVAAPWKTFRHAFASMSGGDELILLDGTYSTANGTGSIHYDGANSGQPPSGPNGSRPTYIHALTAGNVTVEGRLFLGRSFRKDSFIKIQGITFEGGGSLYNTSFVTIKECGFHGPLAVGTNDHDQFSNNNLIEDAWIWASGARIIAINYRAHENVWRRVVVRGDGCGTSACSGSGNPNVGITVYDSNNVSLQNVIVVDRILAPTDSPYADFAVAQHTPDSRYYFGRNEWLGTISIAAPDTGYYMEPDAGATIDPTIKISNAVAWDSNGSGFNLARAGTNNLLENLTVLVRRNDAIRVAPELSGGTLRNVIVAGFGRYGINSAYPPSYADVYPSGSGAYNQTVCQAGCYTGDPRADGNPPSLKYLTRVEAGSRLSGRGHNGSDIGANILYRYGIDGTRHGEPGYNTLTGVPLWPWPHEARIKREMCANTTRGFCSTGKRLDGVNPVTLTSYIWEYLGQAMPGGIYP